MNVCSCSSSPWAAFEPSAPSSGEQSAAARTRVSAKTEVATALTVVTAEGDKVTLSASALSETEFSDYSLSYRRAGAVVAARAESMRQSRDVNVEVSVEGDLSERELADIGKLMRNLQKASRKIRAGDFDTAQKALLRAQNLDSIAAFDYSAHFLRAVSFEGRVVATNASPQAGGGNVAGA